MDELSVTDNADRQRFEIRGGGDVIGFLAYRPRDGVLALTHAEVDPAYRGRGVAGELVGRALDQVRAAGGRVIPLCSYVAAYVRRNPQYSDLVAYGRSDAGGG